MMTMNLNPLRGTSDLVVVQQGRIFTLRDKAARRSHNARRMPVVVTARILRIIATVFRGCRIVTDLRRNLKVDLHHINTRGSV